MDIKELITSSFAIVGAFLAMVKTCTSIIKDVQDIEEKSKAKRNAKKRS